MLIHRTIQLMKMTSIATWSSRVTLAQLLIPMDLSNSACAKTSSKLFCKWKYEFRFNYDDFIVFWSLLIALFWFSIQTSMWRLQFHLETCPQHLLIIRTEKSSSSSTVSTSLLTTVQRSSTIMCKYEYYSSQEKSVARWKMSIFIFHKKSRFLKN